MTFGRSGTGTGMENSIPKIREREGNEKKPFPKFGNGKGMKKSIPQIWEWEGNEKIHSHISGMGIRGYHSQKYPGTGTGMKKKAKWYDNIKKYLENMWLETIQLLEYQMLWREGQI